MGVMSKADKAFSAASPKRMVPRSSNNKRAGQWIMSADVPTDIAIEAAGTRFALHKFPLVARSGKIRKLVAEAKEMDLSRIEFPDIPGGAETFELAAKFCYGINFEINTTNVASLRCAAEYLEMKDDYGSLNLINRTETFISEVVEISFANAVTVLHCCEELLPVAEEVGIVQRCIDTIASIACKDPKVSGNLSGSEYESSGRLGTAANKIKQQNSSNSKSLLSLPKSTTMEWWAEDLAGIRIDFYQRVLEALKAKGVSEESIWGTLMHYAQQSLKGLNSKVSGSSSGSNNSSVGKVNEKNDAAVEHEQRILVETIVSLLPREKKLASCTFLFGLLRTAIILDTTMACRLDIERRIAMQLDQATLDDLLIPSFTYNGGDTLFDVDVVQRILSGFLQQQENEELNNDEDDDYDDYESDGLVTTPPSHNSITKVAKLMDSYLAEIAPDANLKVTKFIALMELLPDYARAFDDGLYRAVDIYLKAHPSLNEQDRKKMCKLLNAQKLSQEACAHAAQNERLPAHFVIQVLYFEQVRIRTEVRTNTEGDVQGPYYLPRGGGVSGTVSAAMSPGDNYSSLRRENKELKMEITRMRMRLSELEKSHKHMKNDIMDKSSSSMMMASNNLLQSFSRKLNKLNPFTRRSSSKDSTDSYSKSSLSRKPRNRRHSYS